MPTVFAKLNLKNQSEVLIMAAPSSFEPEIQALAGVSIIRDAHKIKSIDFALLFVTTRDEVDAAMRLIARKSADDVVLWFAYPKGTSKRYASEINRDMGWDSLKSAGFETVRLVAIDEDWSALRFRRKAYVGGKKLRCGVAGALCALLLYWASWPTSADDARPLTAILLVGRAELPDPDFADSVVLVMNNLGPAPAGIIVNRPTHVAVAELFPDLKRLAPLHDKVYFGGPVQFGTVWFLFRAATPPEHAIQAFDSVYLSADRELLLELLGRAKPMDGLKIFLGHAGWAPGQLEAEIDRGAWNLERADSEAIFNGKSEHPWPGSQHPERGGSPML